MNNWPCDINNFVWYESFLSKHIGSKFKTSVSCRTCNSKLKHVKPASCSIIFSHQVQNRPYVLSAMNNWQIFQVTQDVIYLIFLCRYGNLGMWLSVSNYNITLSNTLRVCLVGEKFGFWYCSTFCCFLTNNVQWWTN